MVSPEILGRLKRIVGKQGYVDDAAAIAPHLVEWRDRWRGNTPLMLEPQSTAEISAILSLCSETRTPIVPQGGNTGLVGGQIPLEGEILLRMGRMNRIRRIDARAMMAIAEAGVVLAELQRAAVKARALFPISIQA